MNKQCTKCGGEPKPLTEFSRDANKPDGYKSQCKSCAGAKLKLWYEAKRERILARRAEYRDTNRELVRKQAREAYLKRLGMIPKKSGPAYLADRADYPDCFSSREQYKSWVIVARQEPPGKSEYCADCTAEYQARMVEEGRCAYPNVTFANGDGERQRRAA